MEISKNDVEKGDILLVSRHSELYIVKVLHIAKNSFKCSRKKIKKKHTFMFAGKVQEYEVTGYSCDLKDILEHNNTFYLSKEGRNFYLLKRDGK